MVLRERLLAATLLVGVLAAGVRAADDEDNPYKEEPDKTTECYGWAADGQCASNPSFMLSSCKYSCWEWYVHRSKKYPDAPIDKSFHCNAWSESGECRANLSFMEKTCPESCKTRREKGLDGDEPPSAPSPPKGDKKKKKKKKKKKGTGDDKEEL